MSEAPFSLFRVSSYGFEENSIWEYGKKEFGTDRLKGR